MAVAERPSEAGPTREPDTPHWPPLRSDLVAMVCFLVVGYCLAVRTWPGLAGGALCVGALASLAPRMTGEFVLRILGNEAKGFLGNPKDCESNEAGRRASSPGGPGAPERPGE